MRYFAGLIIILFLLMGCAAYPPMADYQAFEPESKERSMLRQDLTGKLDLPSETERMVVSSAKIKIKTTNPDSVHFEVVNIAFKYKGYVLSSGNGSTSIRLPSIGFKDAMSDVKILGEVLSIYLAGQDVTEEYKDLGVRIDNAEKTRQRYLELLNKANTIDEILRIEKELERINTELELLKGKKEQLSHLVQYSTITVITVVPKEKPRPGPIGYAFCQLYRGIKWLFVWD